MAKKQKTQPIPKLKRPTRLIDQYRMNDKGDLVKYQVEVPINFEWENEIIPVEKIDTVETIHESSLREQDETETTEGNEDERNGGIPD